MGSSLIRIAFKGLGALLAALLVLSAVGTIVGLVVGFVTVIVTLAVTAVTLAVFLGVAAWLATSLLRGDERPEQSVGRGRNSRSWRDRLSSVGSDTDGEREERDHAERLRERYVDGEIDEAEFERRLALLLETSDLTETGADGRTGGSNRNGSLRERLFE